MTKELQNEMSMYDDGQFAIPELDDSVYNPANDEYRRTLSSVKALIRSTALQLRPRQAVIVKAYFHATSKAEVARVYKCSPATVAKLVGSELGKRLLSLLVHHSTLIEGTTSIEREQLLWRIALKNEDIDPKTSISAVSEINKMKVDKPIDKSKLAALDTQNQTGTPPQVIIQLQDPRLTPSLLDVN